VDRTVAVLVAAVGLNLAVGALHGWSHASIPVVVPAWQYAWAGVAVGIAPLAGAALVATGRVRRGAWLVLGAGVATLALELPFHFVVANPDHVGTVEQGQALFAGTAALSVAGDVLLVAVAGWCLARPGRG
jgi:hypothetical protein